MIPAYDVSEAESEGIVRIHFLDIFAHALGMLQKRREFICVTDLRVCNDDKVVVGVIKRILLYKEVV